MAKDNSKNSSNQFPQKLAPWSYDPCTDKSKLSDTHSSNDDNTDTDCEQQVQSPPFANEVPMPKKLLPKPPPPEPASFKSDVHDLNRTCTDLPKSDDESEPPLPPVPPPPERVSNARSRATPDPDPKSRDSAGVGRSSLASGGWSVCEESPSLNSHSCSVSSSVVSEISMFEQCSVLAAPKSMHAFFLSQGPGSIEYPSAMSKVLPQGAIKSVFALLSSKGIPKPVHSHRALYSLAINRFRSRNVIGCMSRNRSLP